MGITAVDSGMRPGGLHGGARPRVSVSASTADHISGRRRVTTQLCQCLHMHFAVSENELLYLDSHVSEMVVSKFFDIVLIHMLTFDQRLWTVVFPSLLRSSIPLSSPVIVEYISRL